MLLEAIPQADRGKDSASGGWVRTHLVGCCFVIFFFFKLLLKIKGGRCCFSFVFWFGFFFLPLLLRKRKKKKEKKERTREYLWAREKKISKERKFRFVPKNLASRSHRNV